MNFVLTIVLLVASVIAVLAELTFPSSDYYGGDEIGVVNVESSKISIPPEIQPIINDERSPAKDVYGGIYVPLSDASGKDVEEIQLKLLSDFFYVPVPVGPDGFRIFRIDTRDVGGFKRYIYSDVDYHIYAKV